MLHHWTCFTYHPHPTPSIKMNIIHEHSFYSTMTTSSLDFVYSCSCLINARRPRQNERNFQDISKCIPWIKLFEFRLWFHLFLIFEIDYFPSLAQIMTWRWQAIIWRNDAQVSDAYMHRCHIRASSFHWFLHGKCTKEHIHRSHALNVW